MNYQKSAFVLVRPPSKIVSTRKIKTQAQHGKLLAEAKDKGLLLYHATVVKREGREFAKQPWVLDHASVPAGGPILPMRCKIDSEVDEDAAQEQAEQPKAGLFCPYCQESMKSGSGRTLHVKSKHPTKFAEYKKST